MSQLEVRGPSLICIEPEQVIEKIIQSGRLNNRAYVKCCTRQVFVHGGFDES